MGGPTGGAAGGPAGCQEPGAGGLTASSAERAGGISPEWAAEDGAGG